MKIGDVILGIVILFAVLLFIIPFPPFMLDIFLTLNVTVAIIILLNTLYTKENLDMSTFPTVLLFTTLFRVSLNLSSTRLILGEGEAGSVIQTFGEFVAGGNIVVGVILFIIIVIVQFLVITKGSERVAEVGARFTLDAMPGKQMAIDADLNAGLINENEAKARRQKIQDEAGFFGSMDGATKFVKNDAILGIILIFVNVIGGIIIGSTGIGGGEIIPIGDALTKYTILTIGDGLVSQIPALLISIATGVLVTKSTKETDISKELTKQLFGIPKVLNLAGGMLIVLAILTPLPKLQFFIIGGIIIAFANQLQKKLQLESIQQEIATEETDVEEQRKPESVVSLLDVDQIELELGYGLIPLVDEAQGGSLLDRVVGIRKQIALELGTIIPFVRLRDNIQQLTPSQYSIKIKGIQVASGEIMFDHYMAMNHGYVDEEIEGIETKEPSFGLPALWITEGQRERAESYGYIVVDPPSIIATHLQETIKRYLHELLTRQDVQTLINKVKENHQVLVDELVPKLLNIGEIQKVLASLLKENVSIRDLVTIFEILADYAPITKDVDYLTLQVRLALRRAICKKYFDSSTTNTVITVDPELQQAVFDSLQQTEQGNMITLDPTIQRQIVNNTSKEIQKLRSLNQQAIVLVDTQVRTYFKRIIDQSQALKDVIVLSFEEVIESVEIQSIGMVSVHENSKI